jgi:hypothetical protein
MSVSTWQRKPHLGLQDRRGDPRFACEGATVIDVLSPQAKSDVQARIMDAGEASLKLSIPFFLSPGSLIRIHMTESVAYAEVRYCTCEGEEYHVGVRVEEVTPKSS